MTLQKLSFKEFHEPCSRNDKGYIHEERRLWIEELDEWRGHKSKLRQNEPDTSPNQLKVGDKVLLDAVNPHIVTTTPNEETPLMVLSIFPFGTVEVSHPKFGTFKHKDDREAPRNPPPQYRLAQSTEEEVYEDIPDDVPPQLEDPPTQPPPPSRPVHVATSYADISECLTRFEQQCFQRFDNIDTILQQICQHLHISSPIPPREPSSDEDV
ncbi:hypothetical protein GOBAR_AA14038 [Gossypium barbadense]|uniref:Uncharacterized protein n=1 Tax=Gossypium barbadense TaxID=3634 RepID=A0A2P5XTC1_GOSBA|nr:hypothetical protein GOBAR_AA14038 [Gossypium barbadense]